MGRPPSRLQAKSNPILTGNQLFLEVLVGYKGYGPRERRYNRRGRGAERPRGGPGMARTVGEPGQMRSAFEGWRWAAGPAGETPTGHRPRVRSERPATAIPVGKRRRLDKDEPQGGCHRWGSRQGGRCGHPPRQPLYSTGLARSQEIAGPVRLAGLRPFPPSRSATPGDAASGPHPQGRLTSEHPSEAIVAGNGPTHGPSERRKGCLCIRVRFIYRNRARCPAWTPTPLADTGTGVVGVWAGASRAHPYPGWTAEGVPRVRRGRFRATGRHERSPSERDSSNDS